MEDDFFEEYRNKDLTGIKKFNFKKSKAAKTIGNQFSLLDNISEVNSVHNKSEVGSTKTSHQQPKHSFREKEVTTEEFDLLSKSKVFSEISCSNYNSYESTIDSKKKSPFKQKEVTNTKINSLNKTSIEEGRADTILDSLYKKTLSIKKSLVATEKPSEGQFTLKNKEHFDNVTLKGTEISKQPLNVKKNDCKIKVTEGSPSLLSGRSKFTSKGAFSVSKYFNNENTIKSGGLTPFKKILETKKCTVSDEKEKCKTEKKLNDCVFSDEKSNSSILESEKPNRIYDSSSKYIVRSDSSNATTDSPIIKPKKFVFKKNQLTSSSSQEKRSFDNLFNGSKQSGNFSNDLPSKPDEALINNFNLDLSINDLENKGNDKNSTLSYNKFCDLQSDQKEGDIKKNLVTENQEQFLASQSVSTSQSLKITDDDYMDDEEFERRFGSLAEQFDENMFDNKEKDVTKNGISVNSQNNPAKNLDHNTEELLNDISNINWDENIFEDEPTQEGFKDRDDDSEKFKGNYEHSEVMLEMLHQKFGLRSFRPHQREVINASLMQHDCFVLMPTGGGKSLCYQLPAVLMPGVTVVISPLRALISDQVDKLNALDITAAHLCSDVSKAESEQIYMKLSMREPAIKLLYLTPEKINASRFIIDMLDSLYQRGKLARFVIDEVHCLSQWGHDFRPDYKQLSKLRKNYIDVPIICLTATATKQVEQDVINILGLKNVKRFIRSFNRPNIKYQVIPKKGKETINEIANLIKTNFQKKSGIVYCLGRKDCDYLAEKFNELGIKSKPYHAGMNDKVREVIQREWMQDRFHVIVATIAFGMGIDKPDVRFVIHNSIPKSVEAFYQESGRAGRDGEVSYSYLFYSYGDVGRLQRLMQLDRNMSKKTLDAHKENLKQMVSFAENLVDCRRHLQLIHLGEHFDRRICMKNKATICDNCENIDKYKTVDVTKEAKELCTIVKDLSKGENVTMLYVADIYRGAKIKKILDRGHNKHAKYGAGANTDRNDVQRILKELILKHILTDFCTYTGEFPVVYIKTGPKFYQFFNSNYTLHISVCTNKQRKREIVKVDPAEKGINLDNRVVDRPRSSTSTGIVRHTVQKQTTAKLQAARKLQLTQLKVQCHEELLEECRRLAMERNLTLSSIMNLTAIKTMSEVLPKSKEEMLKIQHVTNANYSKYGEYFLKITQKFREKHDALLPLTVTSKPSPHFNDDNVETISDDECPSDFYLPSSQSSGRTTGRGVKRKSNWGSKTGGYKRKRGFRKKKGKSSSPKTKQATTSSGWKGKGGRGTKGSGGLQLMPLHIK